MIDYDATVVRRLEEAGAVLVAKLSTGELAYDDVWFGGQTKNPWNQDEGSGGSSAGPAAATAAGLVGFSLGTETGGSIVEPSARCGVVGLRPTFGRVSRHGAMTVAWSLDKIGTLCRTAEDCAVVLEAIRGSDGLDPSVVDLPFNWDPHADPKTVRVGYVRAGFDSDERGSEARRNDQAVLAQLRALGFQLIPIDLPHFQLSRSHSFSSPRTPQPLRSSSVPVRIAPSSVTVRMTLAIPTGQRDLSRRWSTSRRVGSETWSWKR